jgi:hypothetical protein
MADNNSVLAKAAKAVGKAAGKVAGKTGVTPASKPVPEDLYKAEYVGSGTFKIKKPKRNSRKTHQQRVKNDRGGRI